MTATILPEIDGRPVATRAMAADVLRQAGQPVTVETVRRWERLGLIHPIEGSVGREVWYWMRDVWQAERDTRLHPRRPRGR